MALHLARVQEMLYLNCLYSQQLIVVFSAVDTGLQ